jgi:hypothetical protein
VGSEDVGDERLHSGEDGSQVSGSIASQGGGLCWLRQTSASSEGFGSQEEIPIPTAGAGDGET